MSEVAVRNVVVDVHGRVPADAVEYAKERVAAACAHTSEPVLHARAKLTQAADPAVTRPSIVQANLDLDGRLTRVHVAAASMTEAIDLMHDRLSRRLERMAQHWEARRGRDEPTHRPAFQPRPPEDRQIVRHKAFTLAVETPDEAAFDMDAMDYEFQLFTDSASGQDAVIFRDGPVSYRMASASAPPERNRATAIPLTVSSVPAPCLAVDQAVERLELTGQPFVFFVDASSGRGNVLYHRFDGNYGLIIPAG